MSEEPASGDPGCRDELEERYDALSHLGGPQTPVRLAVLAEIQKDGPLSKRELRDIFVEGNGEWGFEVSKPTLYRQFEDDARNGAEGSRSLVGRGWVSDVSEGDGAESRYALTPKGRPVYEEVSSLFSTFELVDGIPSDIDPFLDVVTKSDFEMDDEVLRELADAEVYGATPTNLYGVFKEFDEFLSECDLARGVSWVSSELFVDQFHRYVVEQDKRAELVLTSEVLQNLVEGHAQRWGEILETGSMEVFECDVYPFGFTVVEHGVAWGYFEPDKGAHEYELVSESDAVREWAEGVFEMFKERGRRVTDEQLEKTRT
ncbi:MAG: helix-turn-helix transcriptional regulator [Halobacteriales archaeon]